MNLYNYGLFYLANRPSEFKNQEGMGIITATDENHFVGVQTLFSSIADKVPFLCYDLGLTIEQKNWCSLNGLRLGSVESAGILNGPKFDGWQTYAKPWLIDLSPFDYTVWMDSDTVVVGDLTEQPEIRDQKTFFTKHWIKQSMVVKNHFELYKRLLVKNLDIPYVNAGVIGVAQTEKKELLENWQRLIGTVVSSLHYHPQRHGVSKWVVNWDEGALNWAIQKLDLKEFVTDNYRLNCFAQISDEEIPAIYEQPIISMNKSSMPGVFFKQLISEAEKKQAAIVHFSTCMDNGKKYWNSWNT